MTHETKQDPVGLGTTDAEDHVNSNAPSLLAAEHMREEDQQHGIVNAQTGEGRAQVEDAEADGSEPQAETGSHFSLSLDEDDDQDKSEEHPINQVNEESATKIDNQQAWNDMIAAEESRGAYYDRRPRRSFDIQYGEEPVNYRRNTWGLNSEQYRNADGEPLFTPIPRIMNVSPKHRARAKAPKPPTRLRKVKSVDDVSPDSSAKKLSPVSPDEQSLDDGAVPASSDATTAPLRQLSSTWGDWDDDEDDRAYLADFIRKNSIDSQNPPSASGAQEGQDSEQVARNAESGNNSDDAERVPLPQSITSPGTEGPPCRLDHGSINAQTQSDDGNGACLQDDSPGDSELQAGEPPSDDEMEPMPLVQDFAPSRSETPIERPPTRHGQAVELAPALNETEGGDQSKPTPADSAAPIAADETDSPTSPTPSTASSVDSTTGMTQREGLAHADAYWMSPSLAKLRAQFKDSEKGKPAIDRIPEDPQDRIALLEAKVHDFREQRDNFREQRDKVDAKLDEAIAAYKEVCREFDSTQDRLYHAEVQNKNLGEDCANAQKREHDLRGEVTHLQDKIAALELEVQAFRERNEFLLQQLQQVEIDITRLHDQEATLALKRALSQDTATGSTHAVATEQGDEQDRVSADVGTRTDGQSVFDRGTQTDGSGTALSAVQTTIRHRQSQRDTTLQRLMLVPAHSVRLPAAHIKTVAGHIADWINDAHQREGGSQIERLTPEQVRNILGNGTTSFFDLISTLTQVGYVFRQDRFAQDTLEFIRGHGFTSLEAMYVECNLTSRDDPTARLPEEIDQLLQEASETNGRMGNDQLRNYGLVQSLAEPSEELVNKESELSECRQHGIELQEALTASELTVKELSEKMVSSDSEEDQVVNQSSFDAVNDKLNRCQEHARQLQVTCDEFEARKAELEAQLQKEQAKSMALEEELQTVKSKFSAANITTEELESEVQSLKNLSSKPAVDAERIRLKRENTKLMQRQTMHCEMLLAARRIILKLEAIIDANRTQIASGPHVSTGQDLGYLPLPPSTGVDTREHIPATASLTPSQATRQAEREVRITETEAYRRTREVSRQRHEADVQQRAQAAELRRQAYKKLCDQDEIPYVPEAARWQSLQHLAALTV